MTQPDERDVMTLAIDQQAIVDGVTGQENVEEFTAVTEVTAFEQRGDQWYLEGNILFSAFLKSQGRRVWADEAGPDVDDEVSGAQLAQVQHRMPFDLTVPVQDRGAGPVGVAVVVPEAELTIVDPGMIGITGLLVIEGLPTHAGYIAHFGAQEQVRGPRPAEPGSERLRQAADAVDPRAEGSPLWRPGASDGVDGAGVVDAPAAPFVPRASSSADDPGKALSALDETMASPPMWPFKSGVAPQLEQEDTVPSTDLAPDEYVGETTFAVEAMRTHVGEQAQEPDGSDGATRDAPCADESDAPNPAERASGWPSSAFAHLQGRWEEESSTPPREPERQPADPASTGAGGDDTHDAVALRGEPVAPPAPSGSETAPGDSESPVPHQHAPDAAPAAVESVPAKRDAERPAAGSMQPQAAYVPTPEPPVEMSARQWFWSTLGIPDSDETYTLTFRIVQSADTVEEIAARYGTTVAELVSVNRLEQSEVMAGSVIRIPR
ncbi:MAG: LysM peptidoglycan-binding domain-containing protein [Firmicutes bacterium]|nr:LysM peptidoglycan-binding domain-containing protein [Bacillota bacterium]